MSAGDALWVDIATAAARLSVSRATLYPYVMRAERGETGGLPSIKLGRARRIRVADLEAFADRIAAESGLEPLAADGGA